MKKIYTIIFMCAALLAGVSCSKQEAPGQDDAKFVVDQCDLVIPAKGGEAKVVFSATEKFDIELNKEWVSYVVDADTLRFSAAANEDFNPRYAIATVKVAGKKALSLTLQQNGFYTGNIDPVVFKPICVDARGTTLNIEYSYSEELEVSTDADWITASVSDDFLTLVVAENTVQGSSENPLRQAKIAYKMGIDGGEILVDQLNITFMEVDDNWTVSYDGVKDYQGEDAAFISNEVADATLSGMYAINYVSQAEFDACGLEMDDYMMVAAYNLKADIEELVEYYQMIYPDITFADFLYEESDYEIFNPLDEGEYIAIAVGFTDDAKFTGHYQYSEFTVQGGSDDPGDPNDISGTWYCASVTDHWGNVYTDWEMKITKSGSGYSIAGFDIGFDDFLSKYSLECKPAPATLSNGVVTVPCNTETGIVVGEEKRPVNWVGLKGNSMVDINFAYDYNKNTLTLTTEAYGAYDDDPEDPGFYSLYDAPVVFKRTSGGGGGGGSTTGYDAFLGEWEIPHGSAGSKNDTWVISKKEEGSTYSITGIEGYSDLSIEAQYDATTSSMVVVAQEEIGTRTISGAECSVGFYGGLASGNFWKPGATPYTVFTASISGNTATLTPGTVKTQDGEVNPEIAFYCATTPEGKYSLLKAFADATKIPNTMTRKGEGGGDEEDHSEDVLGKWICPSASDHWRENTFTNWTMTVKKSGTSLVIDGFDVELDQMAAEKSLTVDSPEAFYSASAKTLTVEFGTETGLGVGDYPIYWVGVKNNTGADIVYKVDLQNYTLTLDVERFGAYINDDDPGYYSLFDAPLVFYKEGHVPTSVKTLGAASDKSFTASQKLGAKGLKSLWGNVYMTAVPTCSPAKAAVRVNGRVTRNARLDSSCSFSSNARVKLIRRVK